MMERKSLSCYLHTGYNIKFNKFIEYKIFSCVKYSRIIYFVFDISFKSPSFLEEKFSVKEMEIITLFSKVMTREEEGRDKLMS